MTIKKTAPKSKSAAKKTPKAPARSKKTSHSKATPSARPGAPAVEREDTVGQEPTRDLPSDFSDAARDKRLQHELEDGSRRSASDRHRERLTAVEAEEDGVRDDADEDDDEKGQRELALGQVDDDEERS